MTHKARAELRTKAAELVRGGKSVADTADELGQTSQWVRSACYLVGVCAPYRARFREEVQERNRQIVSKLKAGATLAAIIQEYTISNSTFYGILAAAGISRNDLPAWKEKQFEKQAGIDAAVEAVINGTSIERVARARHISVSDLRRACFMADVKGSSAIHRTLIIVADLLRGHFSQADIGAKCGVSRERVRQICADAIAAGIPIKKRKVTP